LRFIRDVAQPGSALAWGARGRWFESSRPDSFNTVQFSYYTLTIADKILHFLAKVEYDGALPDGIRMMNPYRENEDIREICSSFYRKFYNDDQPRELILGINPGRLGAGATGIPFTDTKRLIDGCGIQQDKFSTHEPSSVFIYEMIKAYGGAENFYRRFYINSVCPLGFVKVNAGKPINYNYYDSKELESAVRDFIITNIRTQIAIAGKSDICYCLGTGKNYHYLNKLNSQFHFFREIIPLEHPRYIMQYRSKTKDNYINDYLRKFQV
jgi:hypothetical protein